MHMEQIEQIKQNGHMKQKGANSIKITHRTNRRIEDIEQIRPIGRKEI